MIGYEPGYIFKHIDALLYMCVLHLPVNPVNTEQCSQLLQTISRRSSFICPPLSSPDVVSPQISYKLLYDSDNRSVFS